MAQGQAPRVRRGKGQAGHGQSAAASKTSTSQAGAAPDPRSDRKVRKREGDEEGFWKKAKSSEGFADRKQRDPLRQIREELRQLVHAHTSFPPPLGVSGAPLVVDAVHFATERLVAADPAHRDALRDAILQMEGVTEYAAAELFEGLARALAGTRMDTSALEALIHGIHHTDATAERRESATQGLMRALVDRSTSDERLRFLLQKILPDSPSHAEHIVRGAASALGGESMGNRNRQALLGAILDGPRPTDKHWAMIALASSLGGFDIEARDLQALLEGILERGHTSQLSNMIWGLCNGIRNSSDEHCDIDRAYVWESILDAACDRRTDAARAERMVVGLNSGFAAGDDEAELAMLSSILDAHARMEPGRLEILVRVLVLLNGGDESHEPVREALIQVADMPGCSEEHFRCAVRGVLLDEHGNHILSAQARHVCLASLIERGSGWERGAVIAEVLQTADPSSRPSSPASPAGR